MRSREFYPHAGPSAAGSRHPRREAGDENGRAWRTLPLDGSFEVVYEDARGAWTSRILDAHELKLGPGRTLLGGTDRIRRLSEPASGLRIEAGILDWLLRRAEAQRRVRRARPTGSGR